MDMSTSKRLSQVFEHAGEIDGDYRTGKFVFFSDCHRGDNSWSDEFADNQIIYFHALEYYFNQGFTYIEVGDGDELWENSEFKTISEAHGDVFWALSRFKEDERIYLIWGNHDLVFSDPTRVIEEHKYYDERSDPEKRHNLLAGIEYHEGLKLKGEGSQKVIFITHGHQGILMSDRYWKAGRCFTRYGWKWLQHIGIKDPTSPAKNNRKLEKVERGIKQWIREQGNQMIIVGHTHRPEFPAEKSCELYFNCGSCVHPRCITCIEIEEGRISLVKWYIGLREKDYDWDVPLADLRAFEALPGEVGGTDDVALVREGAPLYIVREIFPRCSKELSYFGY
jgi:UDP-2,3-diacylglucosamine pyrophosphatase LpxH